MVSALLVNSLLQSGSVKNAKSSSSGMLKRVTSQVCVTQGRLTIPWTPTSVVTQCAPSSVGSSLAPPVSSAKLCPRAVSRCCAPLRINVLHPEQCLPGAPEAASTSQFPSPGLHDTEEVIKGKHIKGRVRRMDCRKCRVVTMGKREDLTASLTVENGSLQSSWDRRPSCFHTRPTYAEISNTSRSVPRCHTPNTLSQPDTSDQGRPVGR